MTDPMTGREADGPDEGAPQRPVVRDRRRLDPETGQVREPAAGSTTTATVPGEQRAPEGQGSQGGPVGQGGQGGPAGQGGPVGQDDPGDPAVEADLLADVVEADLAQELAQELAHARGLADERLTDLQRLQAEFVNYRRRVERDRDVARDTAVAGILESLLPVLDDVHLARQHGDLEGGPFAAIADKLEAVLQRFGLERYGEPGEAFDPAVHEALMHTEAELAEGTTTTTVVQVLQPGYRAGERVLRPARVAVADPR